jgi:enoyl-CoA hydratase/carnithine racemase
MSSSDLLYEARDAVAVITFNRLEALNALRTQSIAELHALLRHVEDQTSIRALVLTGVGRAFSAGRDLKEDDPLTADPLVRDDIAAVLERYQELTRCLTRMDKVVISAINGVAVGIGAELAVASDIRLAVPQARIAFPEVRLGLFLTNGVINRLPRIIGLGRATEWILSGRFVEADEMLASGLVSRLVQPDALVTAALETAAVMAAHAPLAMRFAKDLLNRTYEVDLEEMLALERDAGVRCVESDDYREGVRAFREKRAPTFSGR